MRFSTLCWMAGCLMGVPFVSKAVEPDQSARKLIEFGWDEPDPAFMRQHIEQMKKTPFDGCVFHLNYKDSTGKTGSFLWEGWGKRAFKAEDLAEGLADLKATNFGRFSHNFLRFNTTPADLSWFDDFSAVLTNAELAARIAREGKARGLLFDIEQYNAPLFDYPKQPDKDKRTWDEYARQVRQRGREVMQAFQKGFPDLTVFLTFGYTLPVEMTHRDLGKLPEVSYGLLQPFLDGMLEAAEGKTRFVDGNELAYSFRDLKTFQQSRRNMKEVVARLTADPDKYRRLYSASYGLWMDYDWRNKGWDTQDPGRNVHSPEQFEAIVRLALQHADEYVWIYTETPRWWTQAGGPEKLPAAYAEAIRRAHRSVSSRPAPAN